MFVKRLVIGSDQQSEIKKSQNIDSFVTHTNDTQTVQTCQTRSVCKPRPPAYIRGPACIQGPASISITMLDPQPVFDARLIFKAQLVFEEIQFPEYFTVPVQCVCFSDTVIICFFVIVVTQSTQYTVS